MSSPKVSVVIGAYNCADFIEETIQSVINQTFTDWELIVVDDCSSDDTCDRVVNIHDKRIKLIKLDKNSGRPAVPRNVGIKSAKGEFISFLDHDDIWLPEKLHKQVAIMEKDKNIALVCSRCFIQKNGKIIGISIPGPKSEYIFKKLFLSSCSIPCSTVMIRNQAGKGRYFFDEDKDLKAIEDYVLWLSIAYREKVHFINEPLVVYRLHGNNTSTDAFSSFKTSGIVIKRYGHMVPKSVLVQKYISLPYRLLNDCVKRILPLKFVLLITGNAREVTFRDACDPAIVHRL